MITVMYYYDSARARYIVEGIRMFPDGHVVTRPFATFITEKAAATYCARYLAKQDAAHRKTGR